MSEIVLIADSDAERGRRLATACHARGLETAVATHGAAALEIALADTPLAMVAQLDLPLIDGPRLSEILHANPRTQSMGILFVADEESRARPRTPEEAGRIVPGFADPDTVARFVEALLTKRTTQVVTRRSAEPGDEGGVDGQLSQISLTELLELFHVNRKTGTVELRRGTRRRGEVGRVFLREGDIVQATAGPVDGEKALYRLFSWDRGTFSFRPGEIAMEARIDRPTRTILREGKRQTREWERLSIDLPPRHAHVTLKVSRATLPNVMHPLTQEVLLVLELSERVQDVLDRCSFPDYQVLRTLHTLIRRGMVELSAEPDDDDEGRGIFASAPAARLHEWMDQGRPRNAPPMDAKLLLVPSDPEAARSFSALLSRLPGAEISSPPTAPALAHVARLPVDDELGIDVFEIPASRRFEPAWPMAAHGALATLVLHTGQPALSVETVRRATEEIAAIPRARVLHVILQGKADPTAAETLCESLALFDDRSVVSIPLEEPDASLDALRDLLTRILP